jgi:hypothetical protein
VSRRPDLRCWRWRAASSAVALALAAAATGAIALIVMMQPDWPNLRRRGAGSSIAAASCVLAGSLP